MATLVILHSGTGGQSNSGTPNSVLYNERATIGSLGERCKVWLDRDNDPANPTEAFGIALGEFDLDSSSWDLFGPDGDPVQLVPGSGNPTSSGTFASPQEFEPTTPGRWLVRVSAQPWIQDPNPPGNLILGDAQEFTVLFEIQDPNVIGNPNAEHPGPNAGDWSAGTSVIAANETIEYDVDEGWSRSVERYLNTVSKGLGGRRIATGVNQSTVGGNPIAVPTDIGRAVTFTAEAQERWLKTDASLEDFQNYVIQFEYIDATMSEAVIQESPIFLTLHDQVGFGERSYLLVDGLIPFDTDTINGGAAAAVGDRVYLSDTGELTTDLAQIAAYPANPAKVRVVGEVVTVGSDTPVISDHPGSIWFHGSTPMLPGLVTGPLASQHDHIVRWDGTTGQKLKDSDVQLDQTGTLATFQPTTNAITQFHLFPGTILGTPAGVFIDGAADDGAGVPMTKVGINTDLPESYLHIAGTGNNDQPFFMLSEGVTDRWLLEGDFGAGSSHSVVCKSASLTNIMTWQTTAKGRVGVGTTVPLTKFHVQHQGTGPDGEPAAIMIEATTPTPGSGAIGTKLIMKANTDAGTTPNSCSIIFADDTLAAGAGQIKYDNKYSGGTPHLDDLMTFTVYRGGVGPFDAFHVNSYGASVWASIVSPPVLADAAHSFKVNGNSLFDGEIVGSGSAQVAVDVIAGNDVAAAGDVFAGGTGVFGGQGAFGAGGISGTKALTVNGDLKVTGVIDPTALIFTEEDPNNVAIAAGEAGLIVSDGSAYAGAPTGANKLYYKDSAGALTQLGGGGGGGGIAGPAASTNHAITRWDGVNGNALHDSGVTLESAPNPGGELDWIIKSGDDGYNGPWPQNLTIRAHHNVFNGVLASASDLQLFGGDNLGNTSEQAGNVEIKSGSGITGGKTYVYGGTGTPWGAGLGTLGGSVKIEAGLGDNGGEVEIYGGHGVDPAGSGGNINIHAGKADFAPGELYLHAGDVNTAGSNANGGNVEISGGVADDAAGSNASGGDVRIYGGNGAGFGGTLLNGGKATVAGGDAFRGGSVSIHGGAGIGGAGSTDGEVNIGTTSVHSQMRWTQAATGPVGLEQKTGMIGINCIADDPAILPNFKQLLLPGDALANRLTVKGSITVTGLVDPAGVVFKGQAGNPAEGIAPQDVQNSTLWLDNNYNLMIGTNQVGVGLAQGENVWQTALNCTVYNWTEGTVGSNDGPEWFDGGGNKYTVHYGSFGAHSDSNKNGHGQAAVLPYGCDIIGVTYRYNHPNALQIAGEGRVLLRVGVLPNSQTISSSAQDLGDNTVWAPGSEVQWNASNNGTHPQSVVSGLRIPVLSGQSIVMQVMEEDITMEQLGEISCVIWLRGQSQAPVGAGHLVPRAITTESGNPDSPYVIQPEDELLLADLSSRASDVVIQLPSATATGRTLTIKDSKGLVSEKHSVVVIPDVRTKQTIDGATHMRFTQQYSSATFTADGNNWVIL